MIRALEIVDPTLTPIKWLEDVEALNKPQTFQFKPGINVLWGKNGSGKTTLIKLLGMLTHCEQSGNPVLTQTSFRSLFNRWGFGDVPKEFAESVKLKHDGQGVRYFDPGNAVGLYHGHFDDDFFSMGIANTIFKGSAGQTNISRFDALISEIIEGRVPEFEWREKAPPKDRKDRYSYEVRTKFDIVESFLKGTGKKGQPTVLLDEPTRSLDLPTQIRIWQLIRAYAPTTQFIVASHSLYALGIPGANYIELTEGYVDVSLQCQKVLEGWADLACEPIDPKVVAKHVAAHKAKAKKAEKAKSRSRSRSRR